MTDHPVPSDHARALVVGAYDTHVHIAPDVMPRRIDDVSLAKRFAEVGMAGFVLKSHYVSTAERAEVVRGVVPGVDVLGAVTLNGSMGGMNPVAVEIAGRQGAQIVWLPTVDSAQSARQPRRICRGRHAADVGRAAGRTAERASWPPPSTSSTRNGAVLRSARQVLGVIAKHDMVLATGHLSRPEIVAVVDAAFDAGVRRIMVTHPEFTSQRLPVDVQRAWPGAAHCSSAASPPPYTGKVSLGGTVRSHPRGRPGALDPLQRPGPAIQPAGRGRSGAGRPAARSRLHRRRDSRDGSTNNSPNDGTGDHLGDHVSARRMLVVGAHSADFVWRAAGTIAKHTSAGGEAIVVALSYGERGESGALWKEPGQTEENVKRIRHGEAEKAANAVGASFQGFDFGDYPLEAGPERSTGWPS